MNATVNLEYFRTWAKAVLQANDTDMAWFMAGATYGLYVLCKFWMEEFRKSPQEITPEDEALCIKMNYWCGRAVGAIARKDLEFIAKQFLTQAMSREEDVNTALDMVTQKTLEAFMRGFRGEAE